MIDGFKTGNSRPPALSPNVVDLVRAAWLVASIEFGESSAGTGHVLYALVARRRPRPRRAAAPRASSQKISAETLRAQFAQRSSAETSEIGRARPGGAPTATARRAPSRRGRPRRRRSISSRSTSPRGPSAGKIDPVLGRDAEIRQMIDILMRRRQNNPILTGEAGVGKTAVVEGLRAAPRRGRRAGGARRTCRSARSTWACCRPAPA